MTVENWRNQTKAAVRRLIGEQASGLIDLMLLPLRGQHLGKPFNDQKNRKALFEKLCQTVTFTAIVETGTFRGATSSYMHSFTGLPIFTIELNPRFFRFAKTRLAFTPGIRLTLGDSRSFIYELIDGEKLPGGNTFYYLDAHWNDDFPLWQEIETILINQTASIVMIDDFQVPGDSGYFYDDYGAGQSLTIKELRNECPSTVDATIFFPSKKSKSETGGKRGCAVITGDPELANRLRTVDLLLEYIE